MKLIREFLAINEGIENTETVRVGKMDMFKSVYDLVKDIDLPGGVEAVAETGGLGDIEMTEDQANIVIANAEKIGHKIKKIGKSVYITSKNDKSAYCTLDYEHVKEDGIVLAFVGIAGAI